MWLSLCNNIPHTYNYIRKQVKKSVQIYEYKHHERTVAWMGVF